jgi:hypothetical protein
MRCQRNVSPVIGARGSSDLLPRRASHGQGEFCGEVALTDDLSRPECRNFPKPEF